MTDLPDNIQVTTYAYAFESSSGSLRRNPEVSLAARRTRGSKPKPRIAMHATSNGCSTSDANSSRASALEFPPERGCCSATTASTTGLPRVERQ